MIPGESGKPDSFIAHVNGNLRIILQGMLHIALAAQILGISSVRQLPTEPIACHALQGGTLQQVTLQQPLTQPNHILPSGEKPCMPEQVAAIFTQQPCFRVVGCSRRNAFADKIPAFFYAML